MFVKCQINVPKYLELVNQNMLLLFKLQFILTQEKTILIATRRILILFPLWKPCILFLIIKKQLQN